VREAQSHERTCIVTRRQDAPEGMIRFVRAPDGAVAPDIRSRLPGRGVWVTARADFVAEAARKQAFSRGLKAKAEAAATLARDVDALLEADCLQMLALANKAGLVITGFGKVATALEKGEARALVEAINGGEDGRRKIGQCARRGEAATKTVPKIVTIFTSSQLDLALGRTNVIHAALAAGGPTEAFLSRCARLTLYRGGTTADSLAREGTESQAAPSENADALENLMGMGRADPRSDSE
jgi:predicted RNA-binding protein YlxR (DUF448 family)